MYQSHLPFCGGKGVMMNDRFFLGGEIPQNYHTFASSLDSLNMGNLMTPGKCIGNNNAHHIWHMMNWMKSLDNSKMESPPVAKIITKMDAPTWKSGKLIPFFSSRVLGTASRVLGTSGELSLEPGGGEGQPAVVLVGKPPVSKKNHAFCWSEFN